MPTLGEAPPPPPLLIVAAQARLRQAGCDAPDWDTEGTGPPTGHTHRLGEDSGPWPFKGWQRLAARACDEHAFETHLSQLSLRPVRCCSRKPCPLLPVRSLSRPRAMR